MRSIFCAAVLMVGTATSSWSEPSALLIGNSNFTSLPSVRYARNILETSRDLKDADVSVSSFENLGTIRLLTELTKWARDLPEDDMMIVALSGHYANNGDESWFLGSDARNPRVFSVGGMGVSIGTIMQVMARHPGQALLILGTGDTNIGNAPFLSGGLGPIEPPQGVTVLHGPRYAVADSLRAFAQTDGNLSEAVSSGVDVKIAGFSPRLLPLSGRNGGQTPSDTPIPSDSGESDAWDLAKKKDTIAGYQTYLESYPFGQNANKAKSSISEIQSEPNRAARLREERLELSRDARREIQRDLSVLGYNTRGIDGIFGRGSRAAIGDWQGASGIVKTGFLTATQISRLDGQATRRVAELEAEAERKRKLAARQDRAFWDETGAKGDETGFRAYLSKYPDGEYAETAVAELEKIEVKKRGRAAEKDKRAWDKFSNRDTVEAYREYLAKHPNGAFRGEAEAKLLAFEEEAQQAEAIKQAKAIEARLGLSPSLARMVELRLAQLGLNPGTVDGTFDRSTRRAIRRYQQDRNLTVTGYMDQQTAVRMLSGGFKIQLK